MSGGKAKRTTCGAKKTKFADETNQPRNAGVHLDPAETEADRWGFTLAPLTLLNTACFWS